MPVRFQERDVYVNTGAVTQTVKVCGPPNIQGDYEYYFRIPTPRFGQQQMLEELERRAAEGASINDLSQWLRDELNAVDELSDPPLAPLDQGDEPAPTVRPIDVEDMGPWFQIAKNATESAIDLLVDDFCAFPYLHRVEHCLHTRLCDLLLDRWPIAQLVNIGDSAELTKLVHKEWPETRPRPQWHNRRGSFDIAVLSPHHLQACGTLLNFLEGRIAAPIVIEIGLNYGLRHLQKDRAKLENSLVRAGYLLHFVRDRELQPQEIELLNRQMPNIKTACACTVNRSRWIKHIDDRAVVSWNEADAGI